jgi:hypothetical protein
MTPDLRSVDKGGVADQAARIEEAHRLNEAVEEHSAGLRLAVMQAKARIAELKATLRSIQRYL